MLRAGEQRRFGANANRLADKFKCLLLRFKRIQQRHYGMKVMAYALINLRGFCTPYNSQPVQSQFFLVTMIPSILPFMPTMQQII